MKNKKITKTKKSTKVKRKKEVTVAVSGGFDPIHIGHVRYMQEAKKLGDKLVVILNNNHWFKIKGKPVFMSDKERKEIIEALECVDKVIVTSHKPSDKIYDRNTREYSVCRELEEVKPDIFANGGDRFKEDVPEVETCNRLGIKMVFNVGRGGKVRSSSELLRKYAKKIGK